MAGEAEEGEPGRCTLHYRAPPEIHPGKGPGTCDPSLQSLFLEAGESFEMYNGKQMNKYSGPWDWRERGRQGGRERKKGQGRERGRGKAFSMPSGLLQKLSWNWAPQRCQRLLSSPEGVVGLYWVQHWVLFQDLKISRGFSRIWH